LIAARAPRWAAPLLHSFACLLVASTCPCSAISGRARAHAVGLALIDHNEYLYDDSTRPSRGWRRRSAPIWRARVRRPKRAPFGVNGEEAGRQILYRSTASYDRLLTLARLGMLPFLVVLIFAVWQWMWRYHGAAVAWLTSAFLLSTPVLLGHAGVVALDVPVTALCTLSFYLLLRWLESPSLGRAALLAWRWASPSAPNCRPCRSSALRAWRCFAAHLLLRFARGTTVTTGPAVGGAVIAVLIALMTVIAGVRTTPGLSDDAGVCSEQGAQRTGRGSGWLHDAGYRLAARLPVPLGVQEVPLNVLGVEWHNSHGHHAFLLGQTDLMGWWYFYPVALAVKTPLPLLLLGLTGLTLLARRGWRERSVPLLAAPLCFTVIFVFCCSYSHINIGVRHVLVLYPLLAIGAAEAAAALWARYGTRAARAALAALLLWQFSTVASAYPTTSPISMPSAAITRAHTRGFRSGLGQDLRRLSAELARRQVRSVSLAYMGTADLTREHLPPFQLLAPGSAPAAGSPPTCYR